MRHLRIGAARHPMAVVVAVALLMSLGACGDGGSRGAETQHPNRHLEGTWALSLRLERAMSLSNTPATLPFVLRGTLTMMTNERSDVSFTSIAQPTQIGVYALRLDSLGLLPWQSGDVPTVAAREITAGSSAVARDSIVIVLNPGMPTRFIRLTGALVGDVLRGAWTAESPLGGGGTFEMRRASVDSSAMP
jgi:hypothetical protein